MLQLPHPRRPRALAGALTTRAAEYPTNFCECLADLLVLHPPSDAALVGQPEEEPLPPPGVARGAAGARVAPLWTVHLCESLRWKTCLKYRFRGPAHINLHETRALKTLCKALPRGHRAVVLQDSLVSLGAMGKGAAPAKLSIGCWPGPYRTS